MIKQKRERGKYLSLWAKCLSLNTTEPTTKVCWSKVRQEVISLLWFKPTENILSVSNKFISCYYRETTCAAKLWSEVCLVWAVTGLQYMKGCWTVSAHTSVHTCSYKADERLPRERLANSCLWLWIRMRAGLKGGLFPFFFVLWFFYT